MVRMNIGSRFMQGYNLLLLPSNRKITAYASRIMWDCAIAPTSPWYRASIPCGNQYVGRNMIYLMIGEGNRKRGIETPLNRHMRDATPAKTAKDMVNDLNSMFHASVNAMHMILNEM